MSPPHLIEKAIKKLRFKDPSGLFHCLKQLSRLKKKSTLAKSFNEKSLASEGKDINYTFQDYLQELYDED